MTKPIITFTYEQAVDFITEKLQDDFSSNFDFIVSIQDAPISISNTNSEIPAVSENTPDNPETIVYNPWLVPDKDGWFTKNPDHTSYTPPSYVNGNRTILIKFQNDDGSGMDGDCVARNMDWGNSGYGTIHKWKYV